MCCGGKMFYTNKNDERVLFCDERKFQKRYLNTNLFSVEPDLIIDFKALPFDDESFYLVIFDPPHIIWGSQKKLFSAKIWQAE